MGSWAAITKIPEIGWLKQQTFNSHSSEAEKSRIKVLADPMSDEVTAEGEREQGVSPVSSHRGTNPIIKTVPSQPRPTSRYYHIGD